MTTLLLSRSLQTKRMKKFLCFIFGASFTFFLSAQPTIQWQKTFGGTYGDEAQVVQQTTDGGYIVAGYTSSNDGDVFGNNGSLDFWMIKLNADGAVQWKKTYGGSLDESIYGMQQTLDGGFMAVGYTRSTNGDVSGHNGYFDAWVLKLDQNGNIQWQKALGGSDWEEAWDVQQTADGGYIVVGRSRFPDGDVTINHGDADFWIVKLSSTGIIEWQRSHGGNDEDIAYAVKQTPDGGYIVAGESYSTEGDVTGNHGNADFWVIKLNFDGKIEWEKSYGGSYLDRANDIQLTHDGGYIVFGISYSMDGDVIGNHGSGDFWVVKLSKTGDLEWQKSLGGSAEEFARTMNLTNDHGYILTGLAGSTNGDVIGNDGGGDLWVVKLSGTGDLEWQKTYGGTKPEVGSSIQQTTDGGYIAAGYAWSSDGDVSVNKGKTDFWVVKLSPEFSPTSEIHARTLKIYPNPATNTISFLPAVALAEEGLAVSPAVASAEEGLFVQITDLLGQVLSHQTISTNQTVDVSTLPNGLYILSAVTTSGKVFSGKFSKLD